MKFIQSEAHVGHTMKLLPSKTMLHDLALVLFVFSVHHGTCPLSRHAQFHFREKG